MDNNDSKSLSTIALVIIVIAGICLGYFVYVTLLSAPATNTINNETAQLSTDQYKSLTEVKDYGQKVTSTEPGYGRSNPFAPVAQ